MYSVYFCISSSLQRSLLHRTSTFVHIVDCMQAQEIPEELLSRMVSIVDMVVETSLVSSAVLLEDTSRLDGFTEEDKGKFIDIPLEGGLLQIEVYILMITFTSLVPQAYFQLFNVAHRKCLNCMI